MKLTLSVCALALVASASQTFAGAPATCTPTGFMRDGLNLTAARINPPGTVSGNVDGTGCNIVIYYGPNTRGHVVAANVHGANYYGIVNNGGNIDVENSAISDIGEKPFNGTQHGVAVYWASGSGAKGEIESNFIWNYQKGGIVVNGPNTSASIQNNSVIGLGPVNYIAQNGIEAGLGAETRIQQNLVTGNSYTGPGGASSGGILVYGGPCFGGPITTNTLVQQNTALGNDVGIYLINLDVQPTCNPVSTPTKNTAQGNALINNAVNNTSGNGDGRGYQAGIDDQGDFDVIRFNLICGPGYTGPSTPTTVIIPIDTTATNNPKVDDNVICGKNTEPEATANVAAAAAPLSAAKPKPSPAP